MPDQNQTTDTSFNPATGSSPFDQSGTKTPIGISDTPQAPPPQPTITTMPSDADMPTPPTSFEPPPSPQSESVQDINVNISSPAASSGNAPPPEKTPSSPGDSGNNNIGIPPVVGAAPPSKKPKKKVIATILGFLLLVGGIGAGVILVQQQQDIREQAAEQQTTGSYEKTCTTPPVPGQTVCTNTGKLYQGNCAVYYCPNGCGSDNKCDENDKENGGWWVNIPCDQISLGSGICGQIDYLDSENVYCNDGKCGYKQIRCEGTLSPSTYCAQTPQKPIPAPTPAPSPSPHVCTEWSGPINISALPGSGTLQTHSDFVYPNGQTLMQAIWRGDKGYSRTVPIVNGVPDFNQAGGWSAPIDISTLPGSGTLQTQTTIVSDNTSPYQPIIQGIWRGDQGWIRTVPVGTSGVPQFGNPNPWEGPIAIDSLPGSSAIQTQSDIVYPNGQTLMQGFWRGDQGWTRLVPIIDEKPDWSTCPPITPVPPAPQAPQCLNIKAFDIEWNQLQPSDLSDLKAGDKVRFTVAGTPAESITKARFVINGTIRPEIPSIPENKRPGTNEFFDEYTIPQGIINFIINAQLYHTTYGWF